LSSYQSTRRRYSAIFEFKNGSRDVLTVWQSEPDSAVEAARNWLEFSQTSPASEAVNVLVEVLGDESDPGDIGIAGMNEDVNHRRFSSEGEPVHTYFRPEPEEVRRLTAALRTSDEGNWPLIRSLLQEQAVDVGDAAVVSTWEWRPERPQHAIIVTRGRHSYQFHDGSKPVDDPAKPPRLPPVLHQNPDRPDWMRQDEMGFEMLERGEL
jgi:hypothetical protein